MSAYYPTTRRGAFRRVKSCRGDVVAGQFIYILRAGEFLKVGRAKDVALRITQLQCGCPLEIEPVVAFGDIPTRSASSLEKEMHSRMHFTRSYGEWFACGVEPAVTLLAYIACSFVGTKAYTFENAHAAEVVRIFEREHSCRRGNDELQVEIDLAMSMFQSGKGSRAKRKHRPAAILYEQSPDSLQPAAATGDERTNHDA